jgi:hypothetical protein
MASSKKNGGFEKLVPVLVFMSVVLAFAVGVLWQKVSNLEGGGTVKKPVAQAPDAQDPANQPPSRPTTGKLSEEQAGKVPQIRSEDHIRGNKNAKVFLVEYSDFECPFCARFHPTAQQVLDEYGDDVAWVYSHFPLDQRHPNARPAAEASECVSEIGGISSGVTGTPGNIILNSKGEAWLIPGALPFEQIKVTIDEALAS